MELRSSVLAEVETRDSDPGVPGPSSSMTEGSGDPSTSDVGIGAYSFRNPSYVLSKFTYNSLALNQSANFNTSLLKILSNSVMLLQNRIS